jgi:enamine deaminase RidA (YjgF/YER057c/UK114 family)
MEMGQSHIEFVEPADFASPKGYANGVLATGRSLHIAGQIGWEADQTFASDDFVYQFGKALDNVVAVVTAAGGVAADIVSMTVYVTDLDAYRNSGRVLGPVWRARMGRHYPAMALVGVAGLVHPRACVEIQAVAVLSLAGRVVQPPEELP